MKKQFSLSGTQEDKEPCCNLQHRFPQTSGLNLDKETEMQRYYYL